MYNAIKTELAAFLDITKDSLHIHIGLAIFLALVLILRRSPASVLPWFGVLAFEITNEVVDFFHWHAGAYSFEIGDAFKDFANTMLWPTVAVITFRVIESRKGKQPVKPT